MIVNENPDAETEAAKTNDGGGLVFDATAEFFKQISGGLQNDVSAKMVKHESEDEAEAEEAQSVNRREKERESDRYSDKKDKHRDSNSRHSTSKFPLLNYLFSSSSFL